jgi:hypothetical protein
VGGRHDDPGTGGVFLVRPERCPALIHRELLRPLEVIPGAQPAGFEEFARTLSEPTRTRTLLPATIAVPDPERLAAVAADYGIEIRGPPGIPA